MIQQGILLKHGVTRIRNWECLGLNTQVSVTLLSRCPTNRHILVYKMNKIIRDKSGATAVEFAFVMPILLLISFGIMEFSAYFFDLHRANEATRIIARNLSRTAPLVSEATLTNANSYTCTFENCNGIAAVIADAQGIFPQLTVENIEIDYEVTDLGNIGYSVGFKPMIVVRLTGLNHDFMVLGGFSGLPDSLAINPAETSILGKWY